MAEAKKLFARYLAAGASYDTKAMLALIGDSMVAYMTVIDANGVETTTRFDAPALQTMTRTTFPQADANKYKIFYTNIQFTLVGDDVHVTADTEYYQLCYHDPNYLMIIGKATDGAYYIKEEHIHTPGFSYCRKATL